MEKTPSWFKAENYQASKEEIRSWFNEVKGMPYDWSLMALRLERALHLLHQIAADRTPPEVASFLSSEIVKDLQRAQENPEWPRSAFTHAYVVQVAAQILRAWGEMSFEDLPWELQENLVFQRHSHTLPAEVSEDVRRELQNILVLRVAVSFAEHLLQQEKKAGRPPEELFAARRILQEKFSPLTHDLLAHKDSSA
jgi:hypothetical protein